MLLFDLGPSELILIWPVPASYSPHLSHAFNVAVTIHTMRRMPRDGCHENESNKETDGTLRH